MNVKNNATTAHLFDEMHTKGSVMNGWSAVLNISHNYLARRLGREWNPDGNATRTISLLSAHPGNRGGDNARQVSSIEYDVDAPQLNLVDGRSAVSLVLPIRAIRGRSGNAPKFPMTASDPNLSWDTDQTVVVPTHPAARLQAEVPLGVRQVIGGGSAASPNFEVFMDFAGAAIDAHHLPAAAGDGGDLVHEIRRTFGGPDGKHVIATVDAATQNDCPPLKPHTVMVAATHTPSGNQVLQVHIATGDTSAPGTTGIDVGDPVPVIEGKDWSLMFSGQKVLQDVVVPDFNARSGHVKLLAVAPAAGGGWYAQTENRMFFQGTVSWGEVMPPMTQHAQIGLNFNGSPSAGLVVSSYTRQGANVDLGFAIAQNYPVQCSGGPGGQSLRFAGSAPTVTGAGVAENTFKPYLDQILGQEIRADMDAVSLAPLATFVERTVHCPGDVAVIDAVQIPGDMVMVGAFDEDPAI